MFEKLKLSTALVQHYRSPAPRQRMLGGSTGYFVKNWTNVKRTKIMKWGVTLCTIYKMDKRFLSYEKKVTEDYCTFEVTHDILSALNSAEKRFLANDGTFLEIWLGARPRPCRCWKVNAHTCAMPTPLSSWNLM